MPPTPVISVEAVQSPRRKHGCKETRPADWSAMRAPSQDMSFFFRSLDVSTERSSPRGYAFFVPLGGGERPFGFAPTFTGHGYYSKKLTRSIGYLAPTFYGCWPLALLDDADADDRRRRLERLDDVRRDRRVGVDQRVGEVAAALVGDRVDVDLGVTED